MITNEDIADLVFHRVADGVWWEFKDTKPLIAVSFEMLKEFMTYDVPCYPLDVVPMQRIVFFRRTDV